MSEITTPVASGVSDVELRMAHRAAGIRLYKQLMADTDGKLLPRHIDMLKQYQPFYHDPCDN